MKKYKWTKKYQKCLKISKSIQRYSLFLLTLVVVLNSTACKKWLQVESPVDKPDNKIIYTSDALATAVLTGLYNQLSAGSFATGANSISVRVGLSSDELTSYSSSGAAALSYYQNNIANTSTTFWSELYKYIYTTNSVIEGINNSTKISNSVKYQLLGEAKFMRAFFHFYLVNLFGDVPLSLSTNFNINSIGTRHSKSAVYMQIIQDLKDAQGFLNDNFVALDLKTPTNERVRPNKGSATALLARAYLYMEDYYNAEMQAGMLINNATLYDTVSLNQVFLSNRKETIWQLQPVIATFNTLDARAFILNAAPSSGQPATVSPQLLAAFESGDERKSKWIKTSSFGGTTYYNPYKYQVFSSNILSEYLVVLRLAEQYLIRAEARAQQNNIIGAQSDLNVIRKRAGLVNTSAFDKQSLLNSILKERQVELFSEWGHRWLDLKRTNKIDSVMITVTPLKGGGVWQSYKQLYPIPQNDVDKSYDLKQNFGY